jgi:hypothetical protein
MILSSEPPREQVPSRALEAFTHEYRISTLLQEKLIVINMKHITHFAYGIPYSRYFSGETKEKYGFGCRDYDKLAVLFDHVLARTLRIPAPYGDFVSFMLDWRSDFVQYCHIVASANRYKLVGDGVVTVIVERKICRRLTANFLSASMVVSLPLKVPRISNVALAIKFRGSVS